LIRCARRWRNGAEGISAVHCRTGVAPRRANDHFDDEDMVRE